MVYWPDVANFLVLMLRFVFTRRKRTQALVQAQGKGKFLSLCLCLRQPRFHGEISALTLGLVLPSLGKTRLKARIPSAVRGSNEKIPPARSRNQSDCSICWIPPSHALRKKIKHIIFTWRYHVFVRKLTCYFLGVYIINVLITLFATWHCSLKTARE